MHSSDECLISWSAPVANVDEADGYSQRAKIRSCRHGFLYNRAYTMSVMIGFMTTRWRSFSDSILPVLKEKYRVE